MTESELDLDLEELESAEDFLEYFGLPYEESVVHVNRLHILQRFHDYLSRVDEMPKVEDERRGLYTRLLARAYTDFVESDAQTEKVFKVFKTQQPYSAAVAFGGLDMGVKGAAEI